MTKSPDRRPHQVQPSGHGRHRQPAATVPISIGGQCSTDPRCGSNAQQRFAIVASLIVPDLKGFYDTTGVFAVNLGWHR
jgi:hypothetical protein